MITVGLSRHELNLITKILDEHKVEYHVDAAGGSEEVKARGGRGDTSFYQIEIDDNGFQHLPAAAQEKLAGLGIYPEMEAPDFEAEPDKERVVPDATKMRKNMKKMEIIFFVLLVVMGLAFFGRIMKNM